MGTDNKSISYNEDREYARRWLQHTEDGKKAATILKENMPKGVNVLDDDRFVDWEEIVKEHRGGTVIATNNAAAREAFRLSSQAKSTLGPPLGGPSKMVYVAAIPLWYHLRRQAETMDPNYWNEPLTFLRECLAHPDWCRVPAEMIRAEMEKHLPRGRSPQSA